MSPFKNSTTRWGIAAAIGAALAASACCTIPLLLITLGLGGAWVGTLTALESFRPLFITVALGALGYAGYREWRISRGPDCDCEGNLPDTLRRALLVVAFVAVAGLIAWPWMLRGTGTAESAGPPFVQDGAVQEVVLEVEGMTCASCNITVRRALTNLDGVQEAHVTFEPSQAVVRYDPSKVTVDDLTRATANVGYPSKLKSSCCDVSPAKPTA